MPSASLFVLTILLLTPLSGFAQQALDLSAVVEKLNKDGQMTLNMGKTLVQKYDFEHDGEHVEAIAFRPTAAGKYPAIMLLPGYSRTAVDYIPMGLRCVREGFACVAITPRGFGKSTGQADFVGPKTLAAMEACYRRFSKETYVDADRMGLFGYSRGAMAASLLAVRLSKQDVKAAVFAAGIYDFKKAYDEITLAGIRENMEKEAGISAEAMLARSSVTQMDKLPCPVLILHGEKDVNAPINQALLLRDKLAQLKKEHELKTFPDKDHDLGRQNLYDQTFAFFKKQLKVDNEKR